MDANLKPLPEMETFFKFVNLYQVWLILILYSINITSNINTIKKKNATNCFTVGNLWLFTATGCKKVLYHVPLINPRNKTFISRIHSLIHSLLHKKCVYFYKRRINTVSNLNAQYLKCNQSCRNQSYSKGEIQTSIVGFKLKTSTGMC